MCAQRSVVAASSGVNPNLFFLEGGGAKFYRIDSRIQMISGGQAQDSFVLPQLHSSRVA